MKRTDVTPKMVLDYKNRGMSFNQISRLAGLDWGCVKQRYMDAIHHDNPELLEKSIKKKMKAIEEKIEAAWQKSRGEKEYDPGYPVKASSNFVDGYKAGAVDALSHQWVSVEDDLPDSYGPVLLFCEFGVEVGYYEQGEWYLNGFGTIHSVTFWMPIPPLPEAREEEEV